MPDLQHSPPRFSEEIIPKRVSLPSRRIGHWWPLVFVILGLALLAPRIMSLGEEPVWLSTIGDVFGILTVLVGLGLLAISGRESKQARIVSLEQIHSRTPEFPFHLVHTITEMTSVLLPDPTGEIPLADHEVPYIPRDLTSLHRAFAETGRVLLRGRSKTGKTRAVIELLREYWKTAPTTLILKRNVELRAPSFAPDNLPRRNLVIIIDDLHTQAVACKRRKSSVGAAVSEILDFFAEHCGNQAGEVRLIAIVRQEPECWEQLAYDPDKPPWSQINLVTLPALTTDEARRLAMELADMSPPLKLPAEVADAIAQANDGTFYHPILAFRDWRSESKKRKITMQDVASLQTDLASTWRHRRSVLFQHRPDLRYVYAALDMAQVLGMTAHSNLISILAHSLRGGLLTRFYGWTIVVQSWYRRKVPHLSCPRWCRRILAVYISLLGRAQDLLYLLLLWPLRFLVNIGRSNSFSSRIQPFLARTLLWLVRLFLAMLHMLVIVLLVNIFIVRPTLEGKVLPLPILWVVWASIVFVLLLLLIGSGIMILRGVKWLLSLLMSLCRSSFSRAVKYVGTKEIPIVDDVLLPYDLQVEGAIREFATQPWVSELITKGKSIGENPSLYGILRKWIEKNSFDDIGWNVGVSASRMAICLEAQDALVYERLGWSYLILEQYDQALVALRNAIELNPGYAQAIAERGYTYRCMEQYEEALIDLDLAIQLEPIFPWAIAERGYTYRCMKRYEEALTDFDRAIQFAPNDSWTIDKRAEIHFHMGRYDKVLADLNRLAVLNPTDVRAAYNRSLVYKQLRRYDEALVTISQAIELDPKYVRAIAHRGRIYLLMKQYDRALADLDQAVEFDSEQDWLHYEKALAHQVLGQGSHAQISLARAIEQAEIIHNNEPENWQNLFNLALYHLASDKAEKAEALYKRVMSNEVSLYLVQQALRDLNDYLSLFPNHLSACTIRDLLQQHLQMGEV
jgi:tetratricopeptide (TPR) repeat protein